MVGEIPQFGSARVRYRMALGGGGGHLVKIEIALGMIPPGHKNLLCISLMVRSSVVVEIAPFGTRVRYRNDT